MEKLLVYLRTRREDMEHGIFSHPPSDWAEFQKRLGRWAELTALIDEIEGKVEEANK